VTGFPRVEPLAGATDLDGVVAIEDASFNNPTSRSWYEAELQRPEVCKVFVVRTEDLPVAGFAAYWRVLDEMHINNLAVHPLMRQRGLGRLLLSETLKAAHAMGIRRATLEVRRSNAPAMRLYEGAGFRLTGVRPNYYSHPIEDALVLAAKVETPGTGW
jgi:[ribosomal protein S18]-alanine N-acetyltransferase